MGNLFCMDDTTSKLPFCSNGPIYKKEVCNGVVHGHDLQSIMFFAAQHGQDLENGFTTKEFSLAVNFIEWNLCFSRLLSIEKWMTFIEEV